MLEEIQTPPEGTDAVKPGTIKPVEQGQPAPQPVDYEKKFKESQAENTRILQAQAAREQAEQELTKEPTDSDLRAAFPEWDSLSDFEKKLARESLVTKRLAAASVKSTEEIKAERSWGTSIELAISSDPALQGKEQAFRQYAMKPQYRGVPMDVLVSSFLQKNPAAPVPPPTPRPGLEPGNGGPRTPEKPTTMSVEDLGKLRESDPRAYQDYLKTHTLDNLGV